MDLPGGLEVERSNRGPRAPLSRVPCTPIAAQEIAGPRPHSAGVSAHQPHAYAGLSVQDRGALLQEAAELVGVEGGDAELFGFGQLRSARRFPDDQRGGLS